MEDTDSSTYSDFERKKWFISRIDLYHKINIESIETSKRFFDSAGEESLSRTKSWRRGIFSVLGIILTAILGINAVNPIPEWIFYLSLAILSGVGLTNFIILNWIISFVENAFNFISNLSAYERTIISESQTFVAVQFADLEKIDLKVVQNYGLFSVLLGITVIVDMANQLRKFRSAKTSWFVDLLDKELKKIDKITTVIPEMYGRFDKSDTFPEVGYALMEKTLKKYIKKKNK